MSASDAVKAGTDLLVAVTGIGSALLHDFLAQWLLMASCALVTLRIGVAAVQLWILIRGARSQAERPVPSPRLGGEVGQ